MAVFRRLWRYPSSRWSVFAPRRVHSTVSGVTSGDSGASSGERDVHATPLVFSASELENAKPYSEIPSPPFVPFFGHLFSFKPFTKVDPFDRVQSCGILEERLGPIFRISLPFIPQFPEWVEILDPHDFEAIFRADGKFPERPGDPAFTIYRQKRRQSLGLLNTNGDEWWKLRQPLNKPMMRANAATPYLEAQDPIGDELVRAVQREIRASPNGRRFPLIMGAFQKWSFESICAVVYDRRLGCLDPDLPPDSWQAKFIDGVTSCFTDSVSLGLNPIHKMMNKLGMESNTEKRFDRNMDFVVAKSVELVEECRRRYEDATDDDDAENLSRRFLPQLLALDMPFDDKLSLIFDMMLAAIDTTTYAVTFNAYHLARNPIVQEKLYEEILEHCGDRRPFTAEILSKMKYLKAVVRETHRLKPVIPLNVRAPARDVVVQGYRIPKGTNCFIEHEYAGKSSRYFEDPLSFKPERWLRDEQNNNDYNKSNPFLILPFGFGARMCIGRRFAEQEMYLGLAKLVQAFKFEYDGELPLKGIGVDKVPVPLDFVIRER